MTIGEMTIITITRIFVIMTDTIQVVPTLIITTIGQYICYESHFL